MEKLIFAYYGYNTSDYKILILAASIRKFAGTLSECPIWILIPEFEKEIPKEMKEQFSRLNVDIKPFKVDPGLKFPFARYILAVAAAESLVKGEAELLVWLGSNTLVINEPELFLLDKTKKLGYRPVHHTLIGSIYEKPINPFWELIYSKCDVSEDRIFPMRTHIDNNILRPYFNSGFLIVRPDRGLLKAWWNKFSKLYTDPYFKEYYEKDELYTIFMHQAVLSGVILSTIEKQEIQELPFNYNYPLNLHFQSPIDLRVQNPDNLVTVRYEEFEQEVPKWIERLSFTHSLKEWLIEQLNNLSQMTSTKKVKFGKVPLVYPIPIVLAGSLVKGKPNFETLGDVGIMGINPPIVFISSGKDHYTNQGILEHGTYSINFPSTKILSKTDYCGTVSGHDVDKSELFDVFFGELKNAPMIKECPVNIECKVIKEFSVQHRQIFIGDVVQTYVTEGFINTNKENPKIVEMTKLDPIIYSLDNNYYKIGKVFGVGYQESEKFRKNSNYK